jgi:hypothetical protein
MKSYIQDGLLCVEDSPGTFEKPQFGFFGVHVADLRVHKSYDPNSDPALQMEVSGEGTLGEQLLAVVDKNEVFDRIDVQFSTRMKGHSEKRLLVFFKYYEPIQASHSNDCIA